MIDAKTTKRVHGWILTVVFSAMLIAPAAARLAGVRDLSNLENRSLAQLPEFSQTPLRQYPRKLEDYYNDRFAFRNRFVNIHRKYQLNVLSTRTMGKVLVGKKQWLYLRDPDDCDPVSDFMGLEPLSQTRLDQWKQTLDRAAEKLESNGIKFLFVIAPNKSTIYPQFLPDDILENQRKSRRRQLVEYLDANGCDAEVLDLTEAIAQKAKSDPRIYFKHDTHWNGLGRYYGYETICGKLNQWFPDITPAPLGAGLSLISKPADKCDLLRLLGTSDSLDIQSEPFLKIEYSPNVTASTSKLADESVYKDQYDQLRPQNRAEIYDNPQGSKKLVVFCDSFFIAGSIDNRQTGPYCEWPLNFRRTVRFHRAFFTEDFLDKVIAYEKPNVIILQYVERALKNTPQEN